MGCWENYPQGALQGNALGPAIWAAISSVIFKIPHKRQFTSAMTASISKQLFTIIWFAHVNDCDIFQIGSNPVEFLT